MSLTHFVHWWEGKPMAYGFLLAVVIFAVLAAVWQRHTHYKKRQALIDKEARKQLNKLHCVEIRAGLNACESVKLLNDRRLLSDEAPLIPLPDCNIQQCTCRYAHFDDRRQHDRRNPYGQWTSIPPALTGERRSRNDRRKSPDNTFNPLIVR